MTLEIVRAGMFTTIQDLGRFGYRRDGVVTSGAMDPFAWRVANQLVGNPSHERLEDKRSDDKNQAALEFFLVGPTVAFHQRTAIAIYGGDWNVKLNGKPIRCGRPYLVEPGQQIDVKEATVGCWGYMAIHGGVQVPAVLGSRSTHVRSGLGGLNGLPLTVGDKIPSKHPTSFTLGWPKHRTCFVPWNVNVFHDCPVPSSRPIRFLPGTHWNHLDGPSQKEFLSVEWLISGRSDRMGYRLEQPPPAQPTKQPGLRLSGPFEMLSEPTAIGTIQLPPSGEPIVLTADSATTGGYPRIGHVVDGDLSRLVQQRPGSAIRFQAVSREESNQLQIDSQKQLRRLKGMLAYQTRRR